jgi:hypothetical protein
MVTEQVERRVIGRSDAQSAERGGKAALYNDINYDRDKRAFGYVVDETGGLNETLVKDLEYNGMARGTIRETRAGSTTKAVE